MNELFVPYEESLQLKELGFDKPCFGLWFAENKQFVQQILNDTRPYNKDLFILAPTLLQVFKFFRDKYGLHHEVSFDSWNKETYSFSINQKKNKEFHYDDMTEYQSYEEAELACLRKLIKIVKNENNRHTL